MRWGSPERYVAADQRGLHLISRGRETDFVPWDVMSRVEIKGPASPGWRTAGKIVSFASDMVFDVDPELGDEDQITTTVHGDPGDRSQVLTWEVPPDPKDHLTGAEARALMQRLNAAIRDPLMRPGPPPVSSPSAPPAAPASWSPPAPPPAPQPSPPAAPIPVPAPGRVLDLDDLPDAVPSPPAVAAPAPGIAPAPATAAVQTGPSGLGTPPWSGKSGSPSRGALGVPPWSGTLPGGPPRPRA